MAGLRSLATTLDAAAQATQATEDERRDIRVREYAKITAFDPDTQLCKVELMRLPLANGEPIAPAEIEDVPIEIWRGGGFVITAPVALGDAVMLTSHDRDNLAYRLNGLAAPSQTDRLNSINDATAQLGGHPAPKALINYDSERQFVGTEDGAYGQWLSPGGGQTVTLSEWSVAVDGDVDLTAGSYLINADNLTLAVDDFTVNDVVTVTGSTLGLESNGEDLIKLIQDMAAELAKPAQVIGHSVAVFSGGAALAARAGRL